MLIPVADLLLTELRRCRCGATFYAPSTKVHRLSRSPNGETFKQTILVRRGGEAPLPILTKYEITIWLNHCPNCWNANMEWDGAAAIIPERPTLQPLNGQFGSQSSPSLIKKVRPLSLDEL